MSKKYVIVSMEGLECPKRAENIINRKIIARRAYCVGTPLIFLFVRRLSVVVCLSVTLSSGSEFCETCMPGTQSAFKTGSVRDILQNLVPTKTILVSHLPIPVSPEISPRGYNSNDLTYFNIVASARKI